jgi:hypothetical protein
MLPHRRSRSVRRDLLRVARLILWARMRFGYIPNAEWARAELSRAVALDRARAHAAISELERCLTVHRAGGDCRRLHPAQ